MTKSTFNYADYDAIGLAQCIREGKVSARTVLDQTIKQIEALNPTYHAVTETCYELAREQLDYLDSQAPLAGVPFLLKDLMVDYANTRTSYGSRWLSTYRATKTGPLIKAYQQAGLIIVGKSVVPEFGFGPVTEPMAYPHPLNPLNKGLTPGGSSGGAAVAVATGMVPLAHANDGGGSIRIPASCCHLFGLKPSRGRTLPASHRFQGRWHQLIVDHVLTRSVRDSAALLDLSLDPSQRHLLRPHEGFLASLVNQPEGLKIACLSESFFTQRTADPLCLIAMNFSRLALEKAGHQCYTIKLPPQFPSDALKLAYTTLVATEARFILSDLILSQGEPSPGSLEKVSELIFALGERYSAQDYLDACQIQTLSETLLDSYFNDFDLIMTPTLASPPVKLGQLQPSKFERAILPLMLKLKTNPFFKQLERSLSQKIYNYVAYTPFANLSGHPAANFPLFFDSQMSLPIGIQLMAPMGREDRLLQLAASLEAQWVQRKF